MGTLSLGKKNATREQVVAEEDPLAMPDEDTSNEPQFDPTAHYGEVCGVQGVKWVQGDNYFRATGAFHSVAPKEARLKPLTKEQEADRQRRLQGQRKFFGNKLAQGAGNVPENIVKAEKENARARAAESLSE